MKDDYGKILAFNILNFDALEEKIEDLRNAVYEDDEVVPGPQGDPGPKGDKGERGDIGPKGSKGDIGPKGSTGLNGSVGKQGPDGERGDTGPRGKDGSQGPKGDQGESGLQGDVYSAWKEWIKNPNHINALYPSAMSVVGGDPLPGSRALGTTFFLENGWKMRTWEGDHELTVTGNFFTRDGSSAFIPTIQPWTITVNLNTSTLVETVFGETNITANDQAAIASSVWANTIAIELLNDVSNIPADVWEQIIDATKNKTAREKLRKIATKTQDIALS